ncbi:hypothetical protein MNBD_GAMMA12-896 [hydrothermal vent metagenome]|uniref:Uncharacterized protein n=1 Tax=hydrothermal vent metagenome TaxID=652676 RepID=A0A3B0YGE0_9ZZZZ
MTIFTALFFYIGLMATVYHSLVLVYVVREGLDMPKWSAYPRAVFRAMLFRNVSRKVRSLAWRWWLSLCTLTCAAILLIGVDQGWFQL